MKNYDQSNNAKEKFLRTSALAQVMTANLNKSFTKEQLCAAFNRKERVMRKDIAELANYVPVVSLSSVKGYKVVGFTEETTKEEKVELANEVQHQINDLQSRIDELKARMKPLIALQKELEKELLN